MTNKFVSFSYIYVLRHLPSPICRKKSRAKLLVIGGRLYEVWEVYGDPMGVIVGHLCEVWEEDGDPIGA